MRPDAHDRASRLISAVAWRRRWLHLARCAAAAAVVFVIAGLISRSVGASSIRTGAVASLVAGVLAAGWARRFQTRHAAAASIERVHPCRNLVVTAEELERHPDRATPLVSRRVSLQASAAVDGVRASTVVPARGAAAAILVAAAMVALTLPEGQRTAQRLTSALSGTVFPATAPAPLNVRVRVSPPAYSGRPVATLDDPAIIEVLEGSHLAFELSGGARVRFGSGAPAAEFTASRSGYFAIDGEKTDSARRLVPLSVVADRAPSVRISAPAKDLLLPQADRTIAVTIHAADDLGLDALELRYTKVSGSGEQFEFVEGSLPIDVQRSSRQEWTASGRLDVRALRLTAGDSLVYRAVARDGRGRERGLATSDTYFLEIAGPGQVALEGVEMPADGERYALSQQMIVVKLERFSQRQPKLAAEEAAEEAASIAAEQRTVRANYVFLLGGHVEDEEEEAAQSHEIQEGRLENTARKDINAAILQMTRVEQALTAVDVRGALPPARAAVESLQRAFGRSRYLLRALAVRSRLDPSRRLTGDARGAADWRRPEAEAQAREGDAARTILVELLQVIEDADAGHPLSPPRINALAERALAIDPKSAGWREIARGLLSARDARGLRPIVGRVAIEASRGGVPRTVLARPESPIERAFKGERYR